MATSRVVGGDVGRILNDLDHQGGETPGDPVISFLGVTFAVIPPNSTLVQAFQALDAAIAGGAFAPIGAEYLVKVADPNLTAERVVTDTATIQWDWATGAQAKASVVSGVFELVGVAVGLIATHEAASDPHPGYQKETEKGSANGYAGLDASSLIDRANQTAGPDRVYRGAGSPEGVLAAAVGSLYLDTTNGDVYEKKTGAGNTGWLRLARANEVPTAGDGLSQTGVAFDVNVDGVGIETSADTLRLKDKGVTNAKMANVPTATFKGRTTAGTGDPEDLTAAQAAALLPAFVGDSGAGGTKGSVPAPAAGDGAAGKFLKADGTFAVPPSASASDLAVSKKILTADFTIPADCAVVTADYVQIEAGVELTIEEGATLLIL